jgi:hypothetical protein
MPELFELQCNPIMANPRSNGGFSGTIGENRVENLTSGTGGEIAQVTTTRT